MVVNYLAKKMGPAANDLVKDVCKKAGFSYSALSPENMGAFADCFEVEASKYLSEKDIKFTSGVIRKLK
ncbi:hypothetical protein [Methanoplanus endosymbiosus]|uniref:Uncharacterized protein n=1 Tax=Methanoplanus endosymbiosus TaxID=33865 RepID=A0A9E7THW5_9EURY|nr:hypothetical protein [Methanoplanus endosymbiosus]UUX91363.1 hypothetical protein L6E24_08215 [Methanoplanus endosymbiosus]